MEVDKIGLKPRIVTLRRGHAPAFRSRLIDKSARSLADSAGTEMFNSFPPFLKFLKKMDKFTVELSKVVGDINVATGIKNENKAASSYKVDNVGAYTEYKIVFVETSTSFQLSEMELYQ